MILAFLFGGMFQYFGVHKRLFSQDFKTDWRTLIYKIVVIYLLFKIGFTGGKAVGTESLNEVLFGAGVILTLSVVWTFFILRFLKAWTDFTDLTQISVAAHFGSVSVGTFIAAMAFLDALNVPVAGSVAIWLALMELPAIFVGMWKLKISFKSLFQILKQDTSLLVLVSAIFVGLFGSDYMPGVVLNLFTGIVFTSILTYFLFEMGRKASSSFGQLTGKLHSTILVGTFIPLLGGLTGISLGHFLGYNEGQMFVMATLMASASYVLAPISMNEILKYLKSVKPKEAENAISTSMALSVGITLPFNIIIGFECYYLFIKLLNHYPDIRMLAIMVPFFVYVWASIAIERR